MSFLGGGRGLFIFLSTVTCLAGQTRRGRWFAESGKEGGMAFVESEFLHSSPTVAASEMADS